MNRRRFLAFLAALPLLAPSCTAPTSPASHSSGPAFTFTTAPIVIGQQAQLWQMGYTWVGDIRPYVFIEDRWPGRTEATSGVYAPADGTVTSVRTIDGDGSGLRGVRVDFTGADGYRFYVNGLETAGVSPGQHVHAGDRIGTRMDWGIKGGLGHVGLGVINSRLTGRFANPLRYPDDLLYADYPLSFFAEPLRSQLTSRLVAPATDPSVSFDVPGTLQGLWYLPSVPLGDSAAQQYRDSQLWFYYTEGTPATMKTLRVSWNGPYESNGRATIEAAPLPSNVDTSTGLVTYHVNPYGSGAGIILLVQMLDEKSLRFEAFDAHYTPNPGDFTEKARIYVR